MIDLSIFPLKSVLFPGGTLPLHIFEERYRQMLGRCIDEQSHFGVVLIKSGREVGGPAEPYEIGTTARIARVQRLDDGRMNVVAVGEERFRIDHLTQSQPYLRARVEILEQTEHDSQASEALAVRVASLYSEYYQLALSMTDQWQQRIGTPQRPRALADFVASRVDANSRLKQRLLETLSVLERLELEREMLAEATKQLQAQVTAARRQRYGGLGALN